MTFSKPTKAHLEIGMTILSDPIHRLLLPSRHFHQFANPTILGLQVDLVWVLWRHATVSEQGSSVVAGYNLKFTGKEARGVLLELASIPQNRVKLVPCIPPLALLSLEFATLFQRSELF